MGKYFCRAKRAYRDETIKELNVLRLRSDHIIDYFRTTFEIIDDEIFHLSGMEIYDDDLWQVLQSDNGYQRQSLKYFWSKI